MAAPFIVKDPPLCDPGAAWLVYTKAESGDVAGGLLVKALDCGSIKRSRVPVPLAAEIYFSSGALSPTSKIE